MNAGPSFNQVVWLDRGWQPAFIGFCPSKRAWSHAMKKLGVTNEPYPDSAGRVTSFEQRKGVGGLTLIVTLGPQAKAASRVEIAGLLCHEATHVWQYVRVNMGEEKPSAEFEAYSMQAIFQGLYQAWLDTCAPPELLAAGAQRVKASA
jgi:hypothetical protein